MDKIKQKVKNINNLLNQINNELNAVAKFRSMDANSIKYNNDLMQIREAILVIKSSMRYGKIFTTPPVKPYEKQMHRHRTELLEFTIDRRLY